MHCRSPSRVSLIAACKASCWSADSFCQLSSETMARTEPTWCPVRLMWLWTSGRFRLLTVGMGFS